MNDTVISVENLSKCYRIGKAAGLSKPSGSLLKKVTVPLKNLADSLRGPSSDELFWAIKEVSFSVKRGEILGIIGRNGAGKSTLLKILSRITEPTEGRAMIHGRVGSLLEVGTGFHPELTGRENIYLNGAILGMKRGEINRKFDEIVDFSGIGKFIDTRFKYYSSGMKVRLGFSVAAHLEPEVLLIDEVLAVGDAAFQKKCLGKMNDAAEGGRTILFVSHNMAAVEMLCTRGILLRHGTVWVNDEITKTVSAYLSSLEDAASQNLADRSERRGKGQVRLTQIDVSAGRGSTSIATGGAICFVFHVSEVGPDMHCAFSFYSNDGQPIATFRSVEQSPEDSRTPALGNKIVCEIDELLLVPGRYRVNAAITCNGELQDHVEAAAFFDVEQGHLRGRAIDRDGRWGHVALHHQWQLPTED